MKPRGKKAKLNDAQRQQILEAYKIDPAAARALGMSMGVRRNYADELASQYMIMKPKVGFKGGKPIKQRSYEWGVNDPRWAWAIKRGPVLA